MLIIGSIGSDMRVRNERLGRLNHPFIQSQFKGYEFAKLALMYRNAIFNGFQHGWEPAPDIAQARAFGYPFKFVGYNAH